MDKFEALLAKSQRLTSRLDSDSEYFSSRQLRRGVSELENSKYIGLDARKELQEIDRLNAIKLLASKNFDALHLADEINKMSQVASFQNFENDHDLKSYLSKYHDEMIQSTFDSVQRISENYLITSQRRQGRLEWKKAQKDFVHTHGGLSSNWDRKSSLSSSQSVVFQSFSKNDSVPSLSSDDFANGLSDLMKKMSTITCSKSLKSSSNSTTSSISSLCSDLAGCVSVSSEEAGLSRLDLLGLKASLELLADMVGEGKTNISQGFFSSLCFSLSDSDSEVEDINSNNNFRGVNDYDKRETRDVDRDKMLHRSILEKRHYLSLGSLSHLHQQQRLSVSREIDLSVERGEMEREFLVGVAEGKSRTQRLRGYVHSLWRTQRLYSDQGDDRFIALIDAARTDRTDRISDNRSSLMVPVWPVVFYHLSWGDLEGALEELTKCVNIGLRYVEKEILIVLKYFIRLMKKYSSLNSRRVELDRSTLHDVFNSKELSDSEFKELRGAMDICLDLFEQELRESERRSIDPFRLLALNLLSLADKQMLADPGIAPSIYTLQSFLWAHIWFASFERWTLAGQDEMQQLELIKPSKDFGENSLFNIVMSCGGEKHFDPHRSNPLKYASVLITCHRFGDAVVHLWSAGKTIPALHILQVCLHYGLILAHAGLTHNPTTRYSSPVNEDLTPAALLQFFFLPRAQRSHPEVTCAYLSYLTCPWKNGVVGELSQSFQDANTLATKTVVMNVFETFLTGLNLAQLTRILGEPLTSGAMSTGLLERFLDKDQILLLLIRSANKLLIKHEIEAAVHFFKLAGRLTDALEELCSQLSLVVVRPDSPERKHWLGICTLFYEQYVSRGQGPLFDCLIKDSKQDLLDVFLKLMNLSLFASSCHQALWIDALHQLDECALFPKSFTEARVMTPQASAQIIPKYILAILDDSLLLAMDCSLKALEVLKTESESALLTSAQQSVRRLEMDLVVERAQALIAFSSGISNKLRGDTNRLLAMKGLRM